MGCKRGVGVWNLSLPDWFKRNRNWRNKGIHQKTMSRHQNAGQNHDIKIGNRCFENVAQFRYLRTTITNQNLIQEEIKRRLNSGNACYYSVQNLLSSRLLSKNLKIRIYKTIILPVVLYGCESWSLTLTLQCRIPYLTREGFKSHAAVLHIWHASCSAKFKFIFGTVVFTVK
jgi:hypothetical protein